jgi:hypothetical protein
MKVKLQDVVEAITLLHEEASAYLNKHTGELITVTTEEFSAAEKGKDLADYPEWQHELIVKAREILDSDDWLALPEKEDIDDHEIMEAFCESVTDRKLSERLLNTIRGSGAFRRFRGALEVLDLEQKWYDFRDAELEKIAVEWLEENQIDYVTEGESGGASEANRSNG